MDFCMGLTGHKILTNPEALMIFQEGIFFFFFFVESFHKHNFTPLTLLFQGCLVLLRPRFDLIFNSVANLFLMPDLIHFACSRTPLVS